MKKNKGGRPSVYSTRIEPNLKYIAMLREQGVNHDDIAKMINVAPSTYYKHKAEIEKFSELLKDSDAEIVEKVENKLYDLALGRGQVVKRKYRYLDDGTEILFEKTVEDIAPDKVAQFFVLTNLANERWKHKQDVIINDTNDNVESFAEVLKEKLNETSSDR